MITASALLTALASSQHHTVIKEAISEASPDEQVKNRSWRDIVEESEEFKRELEKCVDGDAICKPRSAYCRM